MFTICRKEEMNHFAEGCDFLLELGSERINTEIRLLQLTDTQIIDSSQSRSENRLQPDEKIAWTPENIEQRCYKHIRTLVTQAKPDMIFITGDVVYGEFDDSGKIVKDFIAFMDSFQIPWTLVFGNHDNESDIGVEKQCELYSSAKYCMFQRGNVSGNSNFTIGISCGGELKRVLYMLDSNGCRNTSQPSVIRQSGIYPDQLKEMQEKADALKVATGKNVPGFMAFHIPVDCFKKAEMEKGYCTDESEMYALGGNVSPQDDDFGVKLERCSYIITGEMFMKNLHDCGIDGVFVGHWHKVNTCISYNSIKWVYGLKTGEYDYHIPGQIGGTLITLDRNTDKFAIQHIFSC